MKAPRFQAEGRELAKRELAKPDPAGRAAVRLLVQRGNMTSTGRRPLAE